MIVFHVIESRHYVDRGAYGDVEIISHGASTDWKQAKVKEEIASGMDPVPGCKRYGGSELEWVDADGSVVIRQIEVVEVNVSV